MLQVGDTEIIILIKINKMNLFYYFIIWLYFQMLQKLFFLIQQYFVNIVQLLDIV